MYTSKQSKHDKDNKHKGHSPLKHIGMMGACCLLPLAIVSILPLLQINSLGVNRLIAGASSLICPIMMVVMMISMFRSGKGHSCCSHDKKEEISEESK
jgi:hypothetical protein